MLLLALGVHLSEGLPGALTFRGPHDRAALTELVDEAASGRSRSLTFTLPTRAAWSLPLYELALMTKIRLEGRMAASPLADSSQVDTEPLWWPPGKIAGRYLAPFLAANLGLSAEAPAVGAVPVDVELGS